MGVTALKPISPKLAKLLPLLSSDQPGEVVATAAAIGRTLIGVGLTWHDLAAAIEAPPRRPSNPGTSDPRTMAKRLCAHAALTEWEKHFVNSLLEQMRRGRRPSEKQATTLKKMYTERLGGARG